MSGASINNFEFVLTLLEASYRESDAPSITLISQTKRDPFYVLISTIISLRTKDEVTLDVSNRLYETVQNMEDIEKTGVERLTELLYPAGFYRTKARNILTIAALVREEFGGRIPDSMDDLLRLPGVGRKTANLVLILGYNKEGLCVDTHVHRISNRFGWVKTKRPDDTEFALRSFLPIQYWRIINDYLVSYGQTVCRPVSPHCSVCTLSLVCPKIGVDRMR